MADFIRIFVAATPVEWLPAKVLEFSVKETSVRPVQVNFLYQYEIEIPIPKDLENRPRTPFSFQRFLIPEICDFQGHAIYLDADMLVFRDANELWSTSLDGCDLQTVQASNDGRRKQFSVMLLDCEKLSWDIHKIVQSLDTGKLNYASLMYEMHIANSIRSDIAPHWNSLESYDYRSTSLLHYTDMSSQPWVSTQNPLDYLWIKCLFNALDSGFVTIEQIAREVKKGHVRPSLLEQLAKRIERGKDIPFSLRVLDKNYKAPYTKLWPIYEQPWVSLRKRMAFYVSRKLNKIF